MSAKNNTQIDYFDYVQQLREKNSIPIDIKIICSTQTPKNDVILYFGQTGSPTENTIKRTPFIEPIAPQRCASTKKIDANYSTAIETGVKSIVETLKELPKTDFLDDYDHVMPSELFDNLRCWQPQWFKKWLVEYYDSKDIDDCIDQFDDSVSVLLIRGELDGVQERVLYNLYCECYDFD